MGRYLHPYGWIIENFISNNISVNLVQILFWGIVVLLEFQL